MSKEVNSCIVLIAVAIICMLFTRLAISEPKYVSTLEKTEYPKSTVTPTPTPTSTPTPTPIPTREKVEQDIWAKMDKVKITGRAIHTESLGRYYITAYCNCSKCCGIYANGYTASGTECHYDGKYDGTTCAIDRQIHRFNEYIYVPSEDRVYVTEDTGSAVKGRHIDLYFPTHAEVERYGSHYEEVFSVEYVYYQVFAKDYDVRRVLSDNTRDTIQRIASGDS